jgi:hypothetical protein
MALNSVITWLQYHGAVSAHVDDDGRLSRAGFKELFSKGICDLDRAFGKLRMVDLTSRQERKIEAIFRHFAKRDDHRMSMEDLKAFMEGVNPAMTFSELQLKRIIEVGLRSIGTWAMLQARQMLWTRDSTTDVRRLSRASMQHSLSMAACLWRGCGKRMLKEQVTWTVTSVCWPYHFQKQWKV